LTTIAQMTDTETVMNLLHQVPLVANLKDEDKVCIEETEEWRLSAGEMLVEEGKRAEYFFVLLEGEMSVWKKR
jgi:CRP-like cAMP-binding protein